MKKEFIREFKNSGLNKFEAACLMKISLMRIYSWLRLSDTARNPSEIHLETFMARLAQPGLVERAKLDGKKLQDLVNERARLRRQKKPAFRKK